uniref:HifE n=1 Tax=Haemophilus influenzae TaxID=727 RepID=Q9AIR3_HAEIF|nr:HifE [Haemophilus influenzae]
MKTLTTYAKYFTPISKITFLFCFLLGNIAEANIKKAKLENGLGVSRTLTYNFEGDTQMNVTSLQPAQIVFSKAKDNPDRTHIQSSEMGAKPNSLAPFNNWIDAQSPTIIGYSFEGFTCSTYPCPVMELPLLFYPSMDLTVTGGKADGGDIFKLKNQDNLGFSFQIGVIIKGITDWVPINKKDINFLKVLMANFNSTDNVVFKLRAKLHLLADFSSLSNDTIIEPMTIGLGNIKFNEWISTKKSFFDTQYVVRDKGKISVLFRTPKIILKKAQRQCTLNASQRDIKVPLKSVKKRELEAQDEIKGGTFKLRVNCSDTKYNMVNGKWLFPSVKLTFTDENSTTNNGRNDLLRTQTGGGQATGVSLKIKRSNGNWVKYGKDSPEINNPGQFALQKQPSSAGGEQSAEEIFEVYYVKDQARGDLTEGKVKAAATFTMSYQ